eukprot:Phypoly_transcript_08610.p1 GENE.Phypoly_transcript_08610~~Phypoly_transcript_08610.p1  ORF type:complete len:412 (+),score=75.17 Phypoly_transcript_08610:195-1430(+)
MTDTSHTSSTPDTRDLFVQEYEFVVDKTGDTTTVQYFCNRDNEPVYFPDRTLATLFQVNLSTLRGRFNRMTKKHEGYRLLISEKSKTRLSSLHFINWGTENFVDTDGSRSVSPLHGLVALNHIVLVNYALAEWIAYNHERLGTSIGEIENNLKKVNLTYTRTNNVIHILQKRPNLPHPSLLFRPPSAPNRDRLVPRRPSEEIEIPNFSPSSSPSSSPPNPHPLLNPIHNLHSSLPIRKRTREEQWSSELSPFKTNALVPVHTSTTTTTFSPHFPWEEPSMYNLPKFFKMDPHSNYPSSEFDDSSSESGSTPSSPKRYSDNTIQCVLEGENVCHRLDLSCLEGFGALRTALSALFRVNSFNILYQTILDSGYLELGNSDNGDEEKWLQFLAIVKKICVKPYSVTPQLKNLLS